MWSTGNTVVKNNHYVIIVDLPAPTNVTTGEVTPDSVKVTWDQSDGATSYLISYTATGGTTESKKVDNTTSCTLTNLMMDTSYEITVQGCAGDSRKSNLSTAEPVRTGKWFITVIISYHANGQNSTVNMCTIHRKTLE